MAANDHTPVSERSVGAPRKPYPPVLVAPVDVLSRATKRRNGFERAERHVLIVPSAGTGRHVVDFAAIELSAGSLVHVQPGQVHRFSPEPTFCGDVIVVDAAACPPGLFIPGRPRPAVQLGPFANLASALVADLVGEQSRLERSDDIMAATAALLLRHIARLGRGAEPRPGSDVLLAFLADLEVRYRSTRNVTSYSRSIGVSPKTLARVTASEAGLTPKELIDQRVALEAQRSLMLDKTPIAEVGQALGFSEATNFTKFFVRMTGRTPHDFRSQRL